jgi:hypothetical protein
MDAQNQSEQPNERGAGPLFPEQSSSLSPSLSASRGAGRHILIGKKTITVEGDAGAAFTEIFTMTVGQETIDLTPLKNWVQLDTFKWRSRGIFPKTPAGLEVTWQHVKVAGETVSPWDFNACERLEKAFNDWLELELKRLELVKEKAQAQARPADASPPEETPVRLEVDISNSEQPKLKCVEANEVVKVVALNQQGLAALIDQRLMRKPNSVKVGALRNWVELDGQLFRFKEDPAQAAELERVLNERYTLTAQADSQNDVGVFENPASPSGFDLQFPATPGGVVENSKRHLNEETVQLLQDPERCRVLRKGITAKFAPPDLIFKIKTPDGGERNLDPGPHSTVTIRLGDGQSRVIDLSQPVSLLNLGVAELTAILNHPAINRRARLAQLPQNQIQQAA